MELTNITLNASFAPGRFRLGSSSTDEGPDPSAGDQRHEPGFDVLPDPNPPGPAAFETHGGASPDPGPPPMASCTLSRGD
jgi:hypothetical protein